MKLPFINRNKPESTPQAVVKVKLRVKQTRSVSFEADDASVLTEDEVVSAAPLQKVSGIFLKFKQALTKKRGDAVEGKPGKKYFMSLPISEQITFAKRLAILIKAGVPILSAMSMLKKQAKTKSTGQIMGHLHSQLENGQSLSASMEKYRKLFGDFAVNIVRVGEVSGTLNENLNYLADELKKKQELKRKIVGALVYPIFIVVATFGITILLTAYVFPKIMPVFQSFKFQLPWSTRVLITVSNFMQHYWLYLILFVIAFVAGTLFALKQPKIKLWADRMTLRLPMLGNMFKTYQLSNLTRTLGLLLKSDVRIIEALQIVASTIGNTAYRKKLLEVAEGVARGEKASVLMETDTMLFPAVVSQMTAVGETTGRLSDSLLYLAEMHEDELNNITKNLSTSIEPVLMIFMGILVGFIAISIITPIYGVTQNLHP